MHILLPLLLLLLSPRPCTVIFLFRCPSSSCPISSPFPVDAFEINGHSHVSRASSSSFSSAGCGPAMRSFAFKCILAEELCAPKRHAAQAAAAAVAELLHRLLRSHLPAPHPLSAAQTAYSNTRPANKLGAREFKFSESFRLKGFSARSLAVEHNGNLFQLLLNVILHLCHPQGEPST